MRAIAVNEWGGRDRMELLEVEPPPVAPDGVLVRVRAAGLNPVDYKVREGYLAGAFPFHFPVILGWDAAGVVEEVGAAVTWFKPGDPVYGYCRRHELEYGTYAEFTTVPEGFLAHMPEDLSFEEAAALPLAALTAHQSLDRLGLRGGVAIETSRPPWRSAAKACSCSSPPIRSNAASAPPPWVRALTCSGCSGSW